MGWRAGPQESVDPSLLPYPEKFQAAVEFVEAKPEGTLLKLRHITGNVSRARKMRGLGNIYTDGQIE